MFLWIFLALMTGVVVLALLWPLSGAAPDEVAEGDVAFYKAQLAEIERDCARGLIGEREAEAARLEASRRLLRSDTATLRRADATSEPALRRRRAASTVAICLVPIVGLGMYGAFGSPDLQGVGRTGQPVTALGEGQLRFEDALRRVEEHLASNPGDVRGWDVVAPIYLRVGRFADASRAFVRARETGGASAARLLGEVEARIGLAKGRVPTEARTLLQSALALEPRSVPARYYLALSQEQAGDRAGARSAYRSLLATEEASASWSPLVRSRLARLDGTSDAVPTLAASAVTPDINAMVGGLDDRLRTSGGSAEEWLRLVRSLVVLGRRDEAGDRLSKAKAALASDPDAAKRLDHLAGDLGLAPR